MSVNRESESLVEKADAALQQASLTVLRRAQASGGKILIWDDGKPRKVRPEEFLDENGLLKKNR
jgi:hypothetical protein